MTIRNEPMTAEELYLEIKAALKYLDLGYHEMPSMSVWIDGNQLVFSHGCRECKCTLPARYEK